MKIPLEICESLNFEFNYPIIKISPWNEDIKTKMYQLCSLFAEYASPQWFEEMTQKFEKRLDDDKAPFKEVIFTKGEMETLMQLLDSLASSKFSPSGQIDYLPTREGRSYYDLAQRSLEAMMAKIMEAEVANENQNSCRLM